MESGHKKSEIQKFYEVDCGIGCGDVQHGASTKKQFEAQLRTFGWSKTQKYGWVCEECRHEYQLKQQGGA